MNVLGLENAKDHAFMSLFSCYTGNEIFGLTILALREHAEYEKSDVVMRERVLER